MYHVGWGTMMPETDAEEREIDAENVQFNAHAIAGAWDAADELPACVAAAIVNEFTDYDVRAADGIEADHDVHFKDTGIMVEEKAVGVCPRETAERLAPGFIELDRRDGYVLAVNPGSIYDNTPY